MKKQKSTLKRIISLTAGIIMCIACMPIAMISGIANAAASPKNVFNSVGYNPDNSSFDTTNQNGTTLDKWSFTTNTDSTAIHGYINGGIATNKLDSINSTINNFYTQLAAYLKKANGGTTLEASTLNEILNNYKAPLKQDASTTDYITTLLMLDAGYTTNSQLTSNASQAYVSYKSNTVNLPNYGYYKLSVNVYSVNGAQVYVGLNGDIKHTVFSNINTSANTSIPYYYYLVNKKTNTEEAPLSSFMLKDSQASTDQSFYQNFIYYNYDGSNKTEVFNTENLLQGNSYDYKPNGSTVTTKFYKYIYKFYNSNDITTANEHLEYSQNKLTNITLDDITYTLNEDGSLSSTVGEAKFDKYTVYTNPYKYVVDGTVYEKEYLYSLTSADNSTIVYYNADTMLQDGTNITIDGTTYTYVSENTYTNGGVTYTLNSYTSNALIAYDNNLLSSYVFKYLTPEITKYKGYITETKHTEGNYIFNNLAFNYKDGKFVSNTIGGYTYTLNQSQQTGDAGKWKTYTVYISTGYNSSTEKDNTYTGYKTNVVLSLGTEDTHSSGTVYFDDVKISTITMSEFLEATKSENTQIIDYRGLKANDDSIDFKNEYANFTILQNFQNATELNQTGWKVKQQSGGSIIQDNKITIIDEQNYTNIVPYFNSDNKVLKIFNPDSTTLTLQTQNFTLEQFRYYKITLWLRNDYEGTQNYDKIKELAYNINFVSNDLSNLSTKTTKVVPYQSAHKDDTSSTTNYWTEVSFYIESYAIKDTTGYLEITIPESSSILIDNLSIEYTLNNEFKSNSSNTYAISLNQKITTSLIANDKFNYTTNTSLDYSTPLTPENWTLTEDYGKDSDDNDIERPTDNIYTGVIAGYKQFLANYSSYGLADNAIPNKTGYNHLLISNQSGTKSTISYTSKTFSVDSTTDYMVKILAYAKNLNENKAYASLLNEDGKELGRVELNNTSATDEDWNNYYIFVRGGGSSNKVSVKITLETKDGTKSAVLIRSVIARKTNNSASSEKIDELLKLSPSKLAEQDSTLVNFGGINFNTVSDKNSNGLYNSYSFKNDVAQNAGEVGILNIADGDNVFNGVSYKMPEDCNQQNLIIMYNSDSTKTSKLVTNNLNLTTGKYYKLTVTLKADIAQDSIATIQFNGVKATLNIKNTSDYQSYSIYCQTGDKSITTTPTIYLNGKGTIAIADIVKEDSNASEFTNALKREKAGSDYIKTADYSTDKDTEKENEDTENTKTETENKTLEILFAALASILLVGSIIFALVFSKIKTLKKNKDHSDEANKVGRKEEPKGFV